MSPSPAPRLSHCGIYVKDVGKQVEFYTRVLGLIVSDRGISDRMGNERDAGVTDIRQVNHGNALSFYFADPEGNGVEVYMDTPWYVPQPHGAPIDLTLPSDQILANAERHCRETPGFMTQSAWKAKTESRLEQPH